MQVHRSGTVVGVEQQLRLHVYPHIGGRPIAAILPGEIQAMVQRLGESLSPSTVEVIYGRVVAVFRAAVRDRVITSSPCVAVRRPSWRAGVDVAGAHQRTGRGARRDCAGALPGARHRRGRHRPTARRAVRPRRRPRRLPAPCQSASTSSSPGAERRCRVGAAEDPGQLSDGAAAGRRSADVLAAHLARWSPHPDLGVIFTSSTGGPVQQQPWASVWETARRRAGLPEWATPHDLRHHYASVLIRSGASVKVVQARLGHASAKTTLDIYGHLFPDEEDRTRAAVDEAFSATVSHVSPCHRRVTSRPRRRVCPARRLDVVVEVELPRVGPEADGVDLVGALVVDPRLDEVVGEHAAGLEEVAVRLERGERLVERARAPGAPSPAPPAAGRRGPCRPGRAARSCSARRRGRPSASPGRPGTGCTTGRGSGTRAAWPSGSSSRAGCARTPSGCAGCRRG